MPFDGTGFADNELLQKLDAVIDLLGSADRWCKGALRSQDGRYCILGAVRAVSGTERLEPAILQAIGQVAGRRFRRIEAFNDHPNTSHDQVIAVLDRARCNLATAMSPGSASRVSQPPPMVARWLAAWRGWVSD